MNPQTAKEILFANGYQMATAPEGDLVVVSHPTRRVTVAELQTILQPYDPRFVTFYQAHEAVQIFFD